MFARPTGRIELRTGVDYAEIEAENDWLWEDREAVVREVTVIRAYRASEEGRTVDLVFRFTALKDGMVLARRGTDTYGGLNIRMATPRSQTITTNIGSPGMSRRLAWSDLSGVFGNQQQPSGLTVLQHQENPDYPGDWVQYPELSWCQPTFPTKGTRFALARNRPLILRFRLWIHSGPQPNAVEVAKLWNSFNDTTKKKLQFSR